MSLVIGVQARSTSKRFPGKVLENIGDKTMLDWCYMACKDVAQQVYVLPPCGDDAVINHCRKHNYLIHLTTAPENDCLARYLSLAEATSAARVCRITADCAFIFAPLLAFAATLSQGYDFTTTNWPPLHFPDGWDCEVMSPRLLQWLDKHSTIEEREHVTSAAYRSPKDLAAQRLSVCDVRYPLDLSKIKVSIDTEEDLARVREMMP